MAGSTHEYGWGSSPTRLEHELFEISTRAMDAITFRPCATWSSSSPRPAADADRVAGRRGFRTNLTALSRSHGQVLVEESVFRLSLVVGRHPRRGRILLAAPETTWLF